MFDAQRLGIQDSGTCDRAGAGLLVGGTWKLSNQHELRYPLSWLSGKTYGQAGNMLTARLQYAF